MSIAGQRLFLNLRGLRARTYSRAAISAEVDRQLVALDKANPGSQQRKAHGSGLLELELLGLEDFEDNIQRELDVVMARGNLDAEVEVMTGMETGVDMGGIELHMLDGTRRRSRASPSEEIMEVLCMPGERHA